MKRLLLILIAFYAFLPFAHSSSFTSTSFKKDDLLRESSLLFDKNYLSSKNKKKLLDFIKELDPYFPSFYLKAITQHYLITPSSLKLETSIYYALLEKALILRSRFNNPRVSAEDKNKMRGVFKKGLGLDIDAPLISEEIQKETQKQARDLSLLKERSIFIKGLKTLPLISFHLKQLRQSDLYFLDSPKDPIKKNHLSLIKLDHRSFEEIAKEPVKTAHFYTPQENNTSPIMNIIKRMKEKGAITKTISKENIPFAALLINAHMPRPSLYLGSFTDNNSERYLIRLKGPFVSLAMKNIDPSLPLSKSLPFIQAGDSALQEVFNQEAVLIKSIRGSKNKILLSYPSLHDHLLVDTLINHKKENPSIKIQIIINNDLAESTFLEEIIQSGIEIRIRRKSNTEGLVFCAIDDQHALYYLSKGYGLKVLSKRVNENLRNTFDVLWSEKSKEVQFKKSTSNKIQAHFLRSEKFFKSN